MRQAFKDRDFAQAAQHYSDALAALDKMQRAPDGDGVNLATTTTKQRVSLLCNRAQVWFKAGHAHAAVADCIAAMEHDHASLKALYWGAAAARSLEVMCFRWVDRPMVAAITDASRKSSACRTGRWRWSGWGVPGDRALAIWTSRCCTGKSSRNARCSQRPGR